MKDMQAINFDSDEQKQAYQASLQRDMAAMQAAIASSGR